MGKMRFNERQVYQTLKIVLRILKKHKVKYWFEGSIIPTALNGNLYREVHDLDILIVTKNPQPIVNELLKLGYKRRVKNIYKFSDFLNVFTYEHSKLLEVGFFVASETKHHYVVANPVVKVVIPKQNLANTTYQFRGLKFNGLPSAYAFALTSLNKGNPKRKHEFTIFKNKGIKPAKWPLYDFYIKGHKANWAMDVLNVALRVVGRTRVLMGKPYDPWR